MRHLPLLLALASLSGCAMATYKKEGFGKAKTFAVVSIASMPKVEVIGPNGTRGGGSLTGLVKSAGKDVGYSSPADKVLDETVPMIMSELDKSPHFRLMPASSVLAHPGYRSVKADEHKGALVSFLVADGYRYFQDREKLKQLAKNLGVDAVIGMNLSFSAPFSGVSAIGLVAGGRHRAKTSVSIFAVDRKGELVWSDHREFVSAESLSAFGESVNFVKLHPLLLSSSRGAARSVVERLHAGLSGPPAAPRTATASR